MAGSRPRPRAGTGRDERVDALRGVALLVMFVAHCAPGSDDLGLVRSADFLAAPLFALLVGVGAQLADRGPRGLPPAFVRAGIRAAVILGVGLWLEGLGARVDVVLPYLALPVVTAPFLARLPSRALAVLTCAAWLAAPTLQHAAMPRMMRAAAQGDGLGVRLWDVTFTGQHYRFTEFLACTCLGLLVQRWSTAVGDLRQLRIWAAMVLAVGAGLLLARADGRLSFEPYDGSRAQLAVGLTLAGGLTLLWLTCLPSGARVEVLAVAGAMSLSVYTLEVVYLAWFGHDLAPGRSDAAWGNVAVLVVAGLALPRWWRSVVRVRPWVKGPLEGPTALVTGIFDERR